MTTSTKASSVELPCESKSGASILLPYLISLPLFVSLIALVVNKVSEGLGVFLIFPFILWLILVPIGFFIVQPNTSMVLVFFGKYRGTVRKEGFYWAHPFVSKSKISLKANNLASETIKVNDLDGNPIEIGAVVVWQVEDTAKAVFDVEDYNNYVAVQIETAVRELAKTHPYEIQETHEGGGSGEGSSVISLRSDTDAISRELTRQLQERLERAGLNVLEARISHLAYALEIASAMLQRQQAAAIISARRLIVDGAVGMVEHAIGDLQARGVVDLDDERKAAMVSNLLVVLCSHTAPAPVINAGGLYN